MATISYQLAHEDDVVLSIWNLAGQRVRQLVQGYHPAGRYSAAWDGRDDSGAPVANGVYLCRARCGELEIVRKMVLAK